MTIQAENHDILEDFGDSFTTDDKQQFVTFLLAEEEYGIAIDRVQEIIELPRLTKLPNTPHFVLGLMNLRGAVVPVVDLRRKFQLDVGEASKFTVVIVVEVGGRLMGLVVDSVSDVVGLDNEALQGTPEFSSKLRTEFLQGVAEHGDRFLILLDIDRVLSRDELAAVDALAS